MTPIKNKLYEIAETDIPKAGQILADAFEHDPIWKQVLAGCSSTKRNAWFESPVKYCMKYGKAIAPSPDIEGFIGWLPSEFAEMTFERMLRSGATKSGKKVGFKAMLRMMPLRIFDEDRKKYMGNKPHIYVMIVGVSPKFQGHGIGGNLLRSVIAESEKTNLPIYLETSTSDNVSMYEHLGFRVLKKILVPKLSLIQWELLREPKL
ncbi:MAG: GNAT family N-acetyltransferase [Clostridiales bacterium]|nr:GNAT family N-acetyltransferase [Clostridiales bacterium]